MKKIYLKPEMELAECVMLRTGVCSTPTGGPTTQPVDPSDPFAGQAPARNVF